MRGTFHFEADNLATEWNKKIVPVRHDLATNPLFSDEALAKLIEGNPQAIREVSTMDPNREDRATWKRASFEDMSGMEILQAVRDGLLWINVAEAGSFDPRYQAIIDQLLGDLAAQVPGLKTFQHRIGLLISSPNARVFYHCDIPGQGLMHVRGEKTIWIYPDGDPFLPQEALERVVTGLSYEEIDYDPSFEDKAAVLHLKPGMGALWPLNYPHRVVNGDSLNVSFTVEYWTDEIRRHYLVNLANGVGRHFLGWKPRSRAISGPLFWMKAGFAAAWKLSGAKKYFAAKIKPDFAIRKERKEPPAQPFREAAE
ncbi:hypothetical protein FY036_12855 [Mesorhizobium microcysteis]|uniref:JmjC domain-containing protein n=1 Tax=Neoaquamicrobium microcysteis TaxID=2682781 RepID=A0A5D4GXI3_9HYPH|nr:hypothetical protein [Mesorhizobium microcysteis]TYR31975.1 hypothetical protein FY036_12855 [Mesorhizobium microcysteis]